MLSTQTWTTEYDPKTHCERVNLFTKVILIPTNMLTLQTHKYKDINMPPYIYINIYM